MSAHEDKRASEAEFLAHEAERAQAAIANTLDELKRSIETAVDPVRWAKEHPWAALGIAAVSGFAAATIVTPSPGQGVLEKWSQTLGPSSNGHAEQPAPAPAAPPPQQAQSSIWMKLMEPIADVVKTALTTFLVTVIRGGGMGAPGQVADEPSSGYDSSEWER